jgi:predicted N-acetyltransferase YhbS
MTEDEILEVRDTRTASEEEVLYRTTARVFDKSEDEAALGAAATRWRAIVEEGRACYPVHLRAAFHGEQYVGSDVIYERQFRLGTHGEAALRTACIGVVLSDPDHRMKGVGRALMQDAVRFARDRECALLLLAGIPNFYHRFGYVDVLDRTNHAMERARIAELSELPEPVNGRITARWATEADTPALLELYERHYGAHPGGFVRSPEEQIRRLRLAGTAPEYVLAVEGGGRVGGYLKFRGANRLQVQEAAADTWPAARALLHYQMRLLEDVPDPASATDAPVTITWPLPPGSLTYNVLAEHLPLVSESRSRPRAGWMARPAYLPALFQSLGPALESRWRRAALTWSGRLVLQVTADPATDQPAGTGVLDFSPGHVRITSAGTDVPRPEAGGQMTVRLTPGAFTQLLFGFRPIWWIATQPGNVIPDAVRVVLETLFPSEPCWIANSDGF